jgi:hypothetical protein
LWLHGISRFQLANDPDREEWWAVDTVHAQLRELPLRGRDSFYQFDWSFHHE